MALEPPRIVAGPTVSRSESRINCLPIYTSLPLPGQSVFRWSVQLNTWESVTLDSADVYGLIAVTVPPSYVAELYVGISGAWHKAVSSSGEIDPSTGQPWDPLARFYNPLAS